MLDDSCPDYLINGQPFDCYSPDKNTPVRNIWKTVKGKTETQARRIVINFDDSNKSLTELINQFHTWDKDLSTLDELLVVKDDEIIRVIGKATPASPRPPKLLTRFLRLDVALQTQ